MNIEETIPLDISVEPGNVENFHIGAYCSRQEIKIYKDLFQKFGDVFAQTYKYMRNIDPTIVVHEIEMYPHPKHGH